MKTFVTILVCGLCFSAALLWASVQCADYCIWHLFHRHLAEPLLLVAAVFFSEVIFPATILVCLLVGLGFLQ